MIIALLLSCSIMASDTPQKIKLSEDVLDRMNELEEVYTSYLKAGMAPKEAEKAAVQWQDTRYPVILYPLTEKDYKKEDDKKDTASKKKPKDE